MFSRESISIASAFGWKRYFIHGFDSSYFTMCHISVEKLNILSIHIEIIKLQFIQYFKNFNWVMTDEINILPFYSKTICRRQLVYISQHKRTVYLNKNHRRTNFWSDVNSIHGIRLQSVAASPIINWM